MAAFERDREAGRRNTHLSPRPARARRCSAWSWCAASAAARSCSRPTARCRCSGRARCASSARRPTSRALAGPEPFFPIAVHDLPVAVPARGPERRDPAGRRRPLGDRPRRRHRRRGRGGRARGRSPTRARRPSGAPARSPASPPQVKREIARGEHAEIELAELFSESAAQAHRRVQGRPHRHDRARRVPPPRVDVGLRRARGARRAARRGRPRDRAHRHAAVRPHRPRGRAVRRAARAGRLRGADAGRRPRGPSSPRTRSWRG